MKDLFSQSSANLQSQPLKSCLDYVLTAHSETIHVSCIGFCESFKQLSRQLLARSW
jgi:hypothetical protein